ncbi:NAC domain-containing protein 40 [Lactuca sativa]|uniref:NAC domain-containing protein 40 n=1 Tax=Lactuca sativa TaxID=4236 RepID=UPI000CD9DACD|nr:NAC domain-containing protein 40 [Lactuca sativa]
MTDKLADGDGGGDWSMADGIDGDGGGDWSSMKDGIDGDDGCGRTMRRNDAKSLREMQLSIAASSSVFPGFRFSPTDDELISYYLKKKLQGSDNCVDIIPEVDFCRHEPWDLPAISIIQSDNEWFFFSTRGKKYPNGSQSKRATQSGYWKATGKERNVKSGAVTIGTKRTLVFHMGRAPKGERTEWIMHEYCMNDAAQESLVICRLRRNSDFRLNESSRGSSDNKSHSGTTNEYANNNQLDGFHDTNDTIKSASKESTSSYRSHSDDQNDSGSESNPEANPESPHGSSTPYKDVDDCFADIINDDIIRLDESTSHSLKFYGFLTKDEPMLIQDPTKCNQKLPPQNIMTSQGTAVRRIKLRRQKGRTHEPPLVDGGLDQHHHPQTPPLQKKSTGCFISVLSGNADTLKGSRSTHVILVLLFLVMVFVVWKCDMEDWNRQLKHWLRMTADYI